MAANDYSPHLMRYPTRVAIDKLATLLALPNDPWMQDWEILVADPRRLVEFLHTYVRADLDDDDRFTLMRVIVASLDDAVRAKIDLGSGWEQAAALLRRDAHLHAATLSYWSCGVDRDPDHHCHITPRIRPLWHEIRPVLCKSHRFTRPRTRFSQAARLAPNIEPLTNAGDRLRDPALALAAEFR